jgi:mono/diheme cytochrome c family protein
MSNLRNTPTGIAATVLFAAALFITVRAHSEVQAPDAAAFYKTKCVACHGKKAEKKFDASLPEEQMVEIILKGKKVEKPPHMPGYGEKGVTSEQAKALVAYMKELKAAP